MQIILFPFYSHRDKNNNSTEWFMPDISQIVFHETHISDISVDALRAKGSMIK